MRKQPKDEPDPLAGITDPTERLLTLIFPKDAPELTRLDILMIHIRSYLEYVSVRRWLWERRYRRDSQFREALQNIRRPQVAEQIGRTE